MVRQPNGVVTICEKMTETTDGKYKCYMALELAAEKLASKYHERLSKDEKIKADYIMRSLKKPLKRNGKVI